ncbi:MAG: LPS export ABC transporter periplasmic protein LptC [Terriglobia bacterium]
MDKAALATERATVNSGRSVIGPATQRRKRWITVAVLGALAVTVVAIVVVYIAKKARPEGKPPASVELPSNVDQQASGFTFTRSIGGRQVFKIQAASTQALNTGGASVLEQVYVEIYGKTGTRHDTLRTQRAEYSSRSGDFTSPGKVEIELNARPGLLPGTSLRGQQPVYLETSGVHFDQEKSLAVTDAPVRFRIGPASGSAVGMTYATREGWLELKKDVAMDLRSESAPVAPPIRDRPEQSEGAAPAEPKPGATERTTEDAGLKPGATNAGAEQGITRVVASRVLYKKETNDLKLDGPVELSQTGWRLTGAVGTVFLDSQNRPTQTVLEGDVHFSSDSTSSVLTGTTPRLVADFNPATAEIRHLVAEDGVEGESRPQGAADEPSDFEAQQLDVTFSVGHHPEPMKADASGNVKFIFRSAANGEGGRQKAEGSKAVGSRQKAVSGRQRVEGSQQETLGSAQDLLRAGAGSGLMSLRVGPAYRLVPTAYCLPPTADCLLPAAFRLPPPAAARPPAKTETLTASEMLFGFRPDGRSLKEAQTVGAGKLVLNSEDASRDEQVITAGQFLMAFNEQSRLRTLDGIKGTHIVYTPGPAPGVGRSSAATPPRPPAPLTIEESFSDHLAAVFDTSSGDLRSLEQSGNFRYSNGERQSSAAKAQYSSESQVLTLSGQPRLWDAATRMAADRILWHLDTETGEGLGKVQSTHFQSPVPTTVNRQPATGNAGAAGPPVASGTALAVATNVLAEQVIVERRSQLVHYQGHVRAWHDHDLIESSSLDYDGVTHRLSSGSQVMTSHLGPAAASPATRASPTASAASNERAHSKTAAVGIRADSLTYFDENQKASYRGHVELRTEQTTLKAGKMDVYFTRTGRGKGEPGNEGSEVDYVLADDHVTVVEPGRRATGNHCEYLAAPGKVTLTGGPPTVYDEQQGLTTGQRLTFFVHDDSLYVDGGDQSPTISKHHVEQ